MIPDWYLALENAKRILKPGGTIGVVDFYVSRKFPTPPCRRHGWMTRTFWPIWFANDNVFPSPDHVPCLHHRFTPIHFEENRARIRFFPLLTTPYYLFVGRNA
jgi:S-adenosylmethionine-diacylgycerolhomoserine-N-methlytransferase